MRDDNDSSHPTASTTSGNTSGSTNGGGNQQGQAGGTSGGAQAAAAGASTSGGAPAAASSPSSTSSTSKTSSPATTSSSQPSSANAATGPANYGGGPTSGAAGTASPSTKSGTSANMQPSASQQAVGQQAAVSQAEGDQRAAQLAHDLFGGPSAQMPSANAATGVTGYGMPTQVGPSFQTPYNMGNAAVQAAGYGSAPTPQQMADAANQAYGFGPGTMEGMIQTESRWNPGASANKNFPSSHATGYTQLQPNTAAGVGVTDITDPLQNIFGGAKYLGQMMDRFGNLPEAIGGYYAGPKHGAQMGYSPPGGGPSVGQHVGRVMANIDQFNAGAGIPEQPQSQFASAAPPSVAAQQAIAARVAQAMQADPLGTFRTAPSMSLSPIDSMTNAMFGSGVTSWPGQIGPNPAVPGSGVTSWPAQASSSPLPNAPGSSFATSPPSGTIEPSYVSPEMDIPGYTQPMAPTPASAQPQGYSVALSPTGFASPSPSSMAQPVMASPAAVASVPGAQPSPSTNAMPSSSSLVAQSSPGSMSLSALPESATAGEDTPAAQSASNTRARSPAVSNASTAASSTGTRSPAAPDAPAVEDVPGDTAVHIGTHPGGPIRDEPKMQDRVPQEEPSPSIPGNVAVNTPAPSTGGWGGFIQSGKDQLTKLYTDNTTPEQRAKVEQGKKDAQWAMQHPALTQLAAQMFDGKPAYLGSGAGESKGWAGGSFQSGGNLGGSPSSPMGGARSSASSAAPSQIPTNPDGTLNLTALIAMLFGNGAPALGGFTPTIITSSDQRGFA